MDRKVDVLCEFRTMRLRFVNCAVHSGSDKAFAEDACESFDEAVADVAELIEAAKEVEKDAAILGMTVDRLTAALARLSP